MSRKVTTHVPNEGYKKDKNYVKNLPRVDRKKMGIYQRNEPIGKMKDHVRNMYQQKTNGGYVLRDKPTMASENKRGAIVRNKYKQTLTKAGLSKLKAFTKKHPKLKEQFKKLARTAKPGKAITVALNKPEIVAGRKFYSKSIVLTANLFKRTLQKSF